jgi:hypothetical protein
MALALEDLEQAIASAQAAAEQNGKPPVKQAVARKRSINRGALPPHLPREEIVIDVADKTCACCGGLKHRIGEDVSERLDVIPAQLQRNRPRSALDEMLLRDARSDRRRPSGDTQPPASPAAAPSPRPATPTLRCREG